MAEDFNPDEYLKKKPAVEDFDPDAYLGKKSEEDEIPLEPIPKNKPIDTSYVDQLSGNEKKTLAFFLNAGNMILPGGIEPWAERITDKKTADEIKAVLDKVQTTNKGSSALGGALGFTQAPTTKAIQGASKFLGHASELLPYGAKAAKYISEVVAPGAAYVAAMPGEQSNTEVAGGTLVNMLAHKYPWLVGGAIAGSQALPAITDTGKDTTFTENAVGALGGGILGALTGKNLPKGWMSSESLKAPLERLEQGYKEIGEKIPENRRGTPELFKPSGRAPHSDETKSLFDKIDTINISASGELEAAEKNLLQKNLPELGDLRFKPLREVMQNPVELEKVLGLVDKLNKSKGIKEDALTSLNKQIELLSKTKPTPNYDPMNENISAFVVGRAMQTPYRHSQALTNALSYIGTDKLASRELETYKNLLEMNQDVKSGVLNKFLQSARDHGSEVPSITRYFQDGRPLTEKELAELQSQGVKLFASRDQLMNELKNLKGNGGSPNDSMKQENLKLLQEMKEKMGMQSFDPDKGKFVADPNQIMPLKVDLRTMGEDSSFANLAKLTQDQDALSTIWRQFRNNPEKMNKVIDTLKSKNMSDDDVVKLLSTKTKYLDDYLKAEDKIAADTSENFKIQAKNEALRDKYLEKMLNKQKKEESRQSLKDIKENIASRAESDAAPYRKILENMAEGKRQLGIETPDSVLGTAVKDFPVLGEVPRYLEKLGGLFTEKGQLKRLMQNEPYYRDMYQLGKNKETGTPDPDISNFSKIADRVREEYNLNEEQMAQVMDMLANFGLVKSADRDVVKPVYETVIHGKKPKK